MNRLRTTLLVSGGLIAGYFAVSAYTNARKNLEIPADLRSTNVEIPEEANHLSHLLGQLGKTTPEQTGKLREAVDQLKSGKGVEDKPLLDELLRVHKLTDSMLKPPLAFIQDGQPVAVGLFRVFQGADILARQAMFENDRQRADRILSDMIRWSRTLRHAQPNMIQWIISRYGWKMAFGTLLEHLPAHAGKFDEIEQLMRENRVQSAELAECQKMELRWWKAQGGLKAMLDEPDAHFFTIFLKPPFNELSIADLRALPYDAEADFQRFIHDTLETIDCLNKNVPVKDWPGFRVAAGDRTLDDYRKRSNGLGDLFYEQETRETTVGFWKSALGDDRLLEACLLWLKTERNGGAITVDLFKDFLDPVDGMPLSFDIPQRTISSRGMNGKIDARESVLGPLPAAGFTISGDDTVIVVPRWRPATTDHGSDSK